MCRLRTLALHDYQESVTTGQTDRQTDIWENIKNEILVKTHNLNRAGLGALYNYGAL